MMGATVGRPAVDLAVILDRVADAPTWSARIAFTRALGEALLVELSALNLLHMAVLDYGIGPPGVQDFALWAPTLTRLEGLAPVAAPEELRFDAPLEGALQKLERLAWRKGTRRVVVTIGSRPPLPPHSDPDLLLPANPAGDWQVILRHMRERTRAASIALLCPIFWPGKLSPRADRYWCYLVACWTALGYNGMYEAETLTPGQLARAIVAGLE